MKRENEQIWLAAEAANRRIGRWIPQNWIELFIDALEQPDEAAIRADERERCALVVERWSLPTIQTPSMWLIDKAGISAAIRSGGGE